MMTKRRAAHLERRYSDWLRRAGRDRGAKLAGFLSRRVRRFGPHREGCPCELHHNEVVLASPVVKKLWAAVEKLRRHHRSPLLRVIRLTQGILGEKALEGWEELVATSTDHELNQAALQGLWEGGGMDASIAVEIWRRAEILGQWKSFEGKVYDRAREAWEYFHTPELPL